MRARYWPWLLLALINWAGALGACLAETPDTPAYPREIHSPVGLVTIHQPKIADWANFKTLTGRVPLDIDTTGGGRWAGSWAFEAETVVHFDDRRVELRRPRLSGWKPGRAQTPHHVAELARAALEDDDWGMALDTLLESLPPDFQIPGSARVPDLNFSPPRIVVSERPMRLMLIDGAPSMAPIPGTQLEFVINTDWDVFHHLGEDKWYLVSDGHWQANTQLASGSWFGTTDLPRDFLTLQVSSDWSQISQALPAMKASQAPVPFTISYEPTELILIEGEPVLREIPGTVLSYVSNTRSDLFQMSGRYYALISGRWFTTKSFKRHWSAVRQLPAAFSQIPPDHPKAHVLAAVPGTQAARLALIEAAIPRLAIVSLDAGDDLTVPYAGSPSFVDIQGTTLRRAENTPFQVIQHNNFYYLCHDGAWFASTGPAGPWRAATEIPEAIYTIPSTDPAYNVTFVRLEAFDDRNGEAAYSQTSGYSGTYSTGSTLVYGTGWHYPGYLQPSAHIYWRYPYSYGYGAWYNPAWGGWGHRGFYGPYMPVSYHYSATYRVNLPQKEWEWNLDGNKRQVYDYGPRNYVGSGRYVMPDGRTYRGGDETRSRPTPPENSESNRE